MGAGKALYMQNIPNNEIARALDVSETTVSNWVTKGNWRDERSEVASKKKARMDMLGDLIDYQLEALHQRMHRSREHAAFVAQNELVVNAARSLYLIDRDLEDIADTLEIDVDEVEDWVKKRGWDQRKADGERGVLLPLDKGEIDALAKMFAQVKGKELTFDIMVNLVREVVEFLNQKAPDLAKAVIPYTNDFLLAKKEVLTA